MVEGIVTKNIGTAFCIFSFVVPIILIIKWSILDQPIVETFLDTKVWLVYLVSFYFLITILVPPKMGGVMQVAGVWLCGIICIAHRYDDQIGFTLAMTGAAISHANGHFYTDRKLKFLLFILLLLFSILFFGIIQDGIANIELILQYFLFIVLILSVFYFVSKQENNKYAFILKKQEDKFKENCERCKNIGKYNKVLTQDLKNINKEMYEILQIKDYGIGNG